MLHMWVPCSPLLKLFLIVCWPAALCRSPHPSCPLRCHPPPAGKTYANCFLRTALPPSKRCAKSYDVLRYNVSAPGCTAIISHDDFSAAEQLLPPDAATITQLRRCGKHGGICSCVCSDAADLGEALHEALNVLSAADGTGACEGVEFSSICEARRPARHASSSLAPALPSAILPPVRRPVDRIVGAYEFAVDVAARGVLQQGPPGKLGRRKSDWVGTLEVRPGCNVGRVPASLPRLVDPSSFWPLWAVGLGTAL